MRSSYDPGLAWNWAKSDTPSATSASAMPGGEPFRSRTSAAFPTASPARSPSIVQNFIRLSSMRFRRVSCNWKLPTNPGNPLPTSAPVRSPIAAIRPSRIPTSPAYQGDPVPSTMCPCAITTSNACALAAVTGSGRQRQNPHHPPDQPPHLQVHSVLSLL